MGNISAQTYIDYNTVSFYLPTILGTVIAVVTLIAVTVLSIIAIVKNSQKLAGKEVKHSEWLAFASFMTFILGSVALLALNVVSVKARSSSENMSVSLTFNGATLMGIILGAIFVVTGLVCLTLPRKINKPVSKFVINIALTAASAVLMIVTLSCAYNPAVVTKISQSSNRVTMCMPASAYTQLWGMNLTSTSTDVIDETFVLLCATEIIQIVFVIVAGITLMRFVVGLYNGKLGSNLSCSIATTVLSILYMVMAQICIGKITEGQSSTSEKMIATYAIVALVFALLTLGASIAKMIVNRNKNQPQDVSNAQPCEQAV